MMKNPINFFKRHRVFAKVLLAMILILAGFGLSRTVFHDAPAPTNISRISVAQTKIQTPPAKTVAKKTATSAQNSPNSNENNSRNSANNSNNSENSAAQPVANTPPPAPTIQPAPSSNVDSLKPTAPATQPSQPTPPAPSTPSGNSGSSGNSDNSAPNSTPATQPTAPATITTYTSTNWAGYMLTAGGYSGISGAWTVPAASGNGASTAAGASWIGLGGVTTSDLIQVGTSEVALADGRVRYAAFYELLPATAVNIPSVNVNAGDVMTANISRISGNNWTISITNLTNHQTFNINVNYAASGSSAEWIREVPSDSSGNLLPADNFGSASFSGASAVFANGSVNLATGQPSKIILVNSAKQPFATPSAVGADGASFTVTQN